MTTARENFSDNAPNKVIRTVRTIAHKTVYSHTRRATYQVGYEALVVYVNAIALITVNLEAERCSLRNYKRDDVIDRAVRKLDGSAYDWLKPGRREEAKEALRTALEETL